MASKIVAIPPDCEVLVDCHGKNTPRLGDYAHIEYVVIVRV